MGWNKSGNRRDVVVSPTSEHPVGVVAASDVPTVRLPQAGRTGLLAIRGATFQYTVIRERGEEINILSDGTNLYVFVGDVAIAFGLTAPQPVDVVPSLVTTAPPAVAVTAGVSVIEPRIPPPEPQQPVDFQAVLLRDVGVADMRSMIAGSELEPLLAGPPNAVVREHNPWTPSASIAIVGREKPSGEFLARFGGYDGIGVRPANWQDPDERPPEPPPS